MKEQKTKEAKIQIIANVTIPVQALFIKLVNLHKETQVGLITKLITEEAHRAGLID